MTEQINKVVIFDGDCILCNSIVRYLMKRDKKMKLLFTSSQSQYFKTNFDAELLSGASETVYFADGNFFYLRSSAVLQICKYLTFPEKYLYFLKFIPVKIRDWIYDLIAKNRATLFGRKNYCEMFSEAEKRRVLE